MNKFSILIMLSILTIFSCRQDSSEEETKEVSLGVDNNYEQTVFGRALNQDGTALGDVMIDANGEIFLTDENGFFIFEEILISDKGTQFSASKDGYLYGGYRLYAGETGSYQIEIVLLEEKDLGNINPLQGGELQIANNTSVTFPSNAFTLNGTDAYNGNVNVFGNWIDPTSPDLMTLTPGDLSAVNLEGERVILSSFGMVGVELRTDQGEELQIMDGVEAELKFDVPSSIIGFAPASIPLWTFDETNGIWKEEGSASLVGDQYIGNVAHFSWWNCDLPNTTLPFCIFVQDATTGNPIGNIQVTFRNLDGFGQAWGYTNPRGILCGFLPEGVELSVTVGDPSACPGMLPSMNIGPYTPNDLPINITYSVDFDTDIVTNVLDGKVLDCETGSPLTDAVVYFDWDGSQEGTLVDANGYYNQTIIGCGDIDELTMRAIHIASEKEGEVVLNDLTGGTTTTDISLCDDFVAGAWFISSPSGFIQADSVTAKVRPYETHIIVENGANIIGLPCTTTGPCTGTYAGTFGGFEVQVNITSFGAVGGTVAGTFTGTDNNGDGITGNFEAERVQ